MVLITQRHEPSDGHNFIVAVGYFLPGIMAYIAFARWKPRFPGWLLPAFMLGLWAIFWYHCDFHRGWYFCLMIGLGLPLFRQMKSEAILAPSRVIAKYSYGIYLTHPFAIVMGLYLLRNHSLMVRLSVELVTLMIMPVLAYHLLEHPMIVFGSRLAARAEKKYEQSEVKHFRQGITG
jgi:peptidoglycan/LPS O-acetylase OafA/YrhL